MEIPRRTRTHRSGTRARTRRFPGGAPEQLVYEYGYEYVYGNI